MSGSWKKGCFTPGRTGPIHRVADIPLKPAGANGNEGGGTLTQSAGTGLVGSYPANERTVERSKKSLPAKTAPDCYRADCLRRGRTSSAARPRLANENEVGSGVMGIINPVNVALRETGVPGGVVLGLPVRVVSRGLEPNQVPRVCTAASNVVAVPVQPIMKYSAVAPPATPGSAKVPPLNLPATVVIPVVAMSAQPGFATKKPATVLNLGSILDHDNGSRDVPFGAAKSST